jgi:hypothetical protein
MGNFCIFWLENLKERDHFEDVSVDGEDNIRMDLRKVEWTVFISLRIGSTGGR